MTDLYAHTSDPDTSKTSVSGYSKAKIEDAVSCVIQIYRLHRQLADYQLRTLFAAAFGTECSRHLYRQARSVARDRGYLLPHGTTINPASKHKQIIWEYCDDPIPVQIAFCPTCNHVLDRTYRPV